jgi:glycosyltransferase involved in cell wall biosynthesis
MEPDRISVCICTFRRPDLLARLLDALSAQVVSPGFSFDVVVVDNDERRTAETTVRTFACRSTVPITYDCEPERNISLTRNRAVRDASGDLIAFIDDDEYPAPDWLSRLHTTLTTSGADGVLGPVVADFPPGAPRWLERARVFDRRRLATGARIAEGDARTGNVLLRRSLFRNHECWFDPAFGRTGGEDSDFFARQWQRGAVFVWCDEAAVRETVPPERWTASFHIKRLLRAGTLDGEWLRDKRLTSRGMLAKNIVLLGACAALTLPSFLAPKHVRMRVLQKVAYCSGVVTAYFGLSLLRYRD